LPFVSEGDPNSGQLVTADPAVAREHAEKLVGTVVADRYRIHGVIAMGGMGAVLSGEHVHMRKRVAMKVLHPATADFPGIVSRFEREAIVGAHVEHRNIASARDFGRFDDGSYYLVLEFVRGVTLKALLTKGPLPSHRGLRIARQMAVALAKLHGLGIVHRDMNPRNVMVLPGTKDPIKIIDFGFAKVPVEKFDGKSTQEAARRGPTRPAARITADGVIFGTIGYLAPEAALGMRAVDARSDLYALGAILYEMLCGVPPFEADSQVDLFVKHRLEPVPPMRERAPGVLVPSALEAIALRLLAKLPEERYARADDVVRALDDAASSIANLETSPGSEVAPDAMAASLPMTVAGSEPPPPPPRFEDVTESTPPPPVETAEVVETLAPSSLRRGALTGPALQPERQEQLEEHDEPPGRPSIVRERRRASWALRLAVAAVIGAAAFAASRSHAGRRFLGSLGEGGPLPTGLQGNGAPAVSADAPGDPAPRPAASALPSSSASPVGVASARPTEIGGLDARAWKHHVRRAPATRDFARAEQGLLALAEMDPAALDGVEMRDAAVDIAVNSGAAPDGGRRILETLAEKFGADGVDVLYDVMSRRGGSTAAELAATMLARPEVRARGTDAFRVAMDLRNAPCSEKLALVERARREGDGRVLGMLAAARSPECDATTGACCLLEEPTVEIAVRELSERLRAR
jgi:serine/threonine protein kinase